jgi:hypothetical protein
MSSERRRSLALAVISVAGLCMVVTLRHGEQMEKSEAGRSDMSDRKSIARVATAGGLGSVQSTNQATATSVTADDVAMTEASASRPAAGEQSTSAGVASPDFRSGKHDALSAPAQQEPVMEAQPVDGAQAAPSDDVRSFWAPPIAKVGANPQRAEKTWRAVEPDAPRATMTIREPDVPLGFMLDPADYRDGTLIFVTSQPGLSVLSLHGAAARACLVDGMPAVEGKTYLVHDGLEITASATVGVHLRPATSAAQSTTGPAGIG